MTTEIPEALAVLDRTINYIQNRCELCPSDNEMRKARAAFARLVDDVQAYLDKSTLDNRMDMIEALAAVETLK